MGRRKKKESRSVPLVGYTTQTHKDMVAKFVQENLPGVTLSTFVLQQVEKIVPQKDPDKKALAHA